MSESLVPATPAVPERRVSPKLLVPDNDSALAEVARAAGQVWATEPTLTLRWLPLADYTAAQTQFAQQLQGKRAAAAERSPQVVRLQQLDDELDEGLRYLKTYVQEEAGTKAAAEALYPGYGLKRRKKGGFGLPKDRGERLESLNMLVPNVQGGPLATRKYGSAFWAPRLAEYISLMQQSGTLAGTVAKQTGSKNEVKKLLRKALKALVLLLEANFPDTYAAELQRWGFRRSTY